MKDGLGMDRMEEEEEEVVRVFRCEETSLLHMIGIEIGMFVFWDSGHSLRKLGFVI